VSQLTVVSTSQGYIHKYGKLKRKYIIAVLIFILTLCNPIFLLTVYSPALICLGDKEVGGLLVIILQF
jgi:hypothetical protein